MVTKEEVYEVLKKCRDPEIPVNIVDLGLVYDVKVDGDVVNVKMTLTAVGCPMHAYIAQDVKSKLEAMEGVNEANVEIVWDPQWTPEMITPEGRKALGMD